MPGAAPLHRQVLAQAAMESKLMLRNGEQLLLAVVIPVIVLIGGVTGAERVGIDLEHAADRRVRPRRAGAGGDVDRVHVAGDRDRLRAAVRRHQAARLLAAAALRAARRQDRRPAARRDAADRRDLRGGVRARLGPRTRRHRRGARRRRSAPLRSRRSGCSSPARCAPRPRWPRPTSSTCCCSPAAPSCSRSRRTARSATSSAGCPPARSAARCASSLIDGGVAWRDLAVLLGWAVLGTVLTARTFKWE